MSDCSVSVIVPTYNAANQIEQLLNMLAKQTMPHSLLVIDSESDDETQEILLRRNVKFIIVTKTEFNHGRTRNLGVSCIDTDWVVFMTQDAIPESEMTLENLLNARMQREDISLIYGRQLPHLNTGIFGRLARYLHYPDQNIIKDISLIPKMGIRTCSCSNSFAAYKVSDFKAVNCFPINTILGEDVTLAAKLILSGKSIAYCSEARVFHAHDYTITEEFRRYFDIGVFHEQQHETLNHFMKAEGEGVSYAINEASLLIKEGKAYLLPEQMVRLSVKYIAYKLGRYYKILPLVFKRNISMHPRFWSK